MRGAESCGDQAAIGIGCGRNDSPLVNGATWEARAAKLFPSDVEMQVALATLRVRVPLRYFQNTTMNGTSMDVPLNG